MTPAISPSQEAEQQHGLASAPVMNLNVRLLSGARMLPQPWRCFSRAAEDLALQRIRKVLCVAEKNDAARGIAELLSNSRMRRVGTAHVVLLPAAWRQGWGGSVWCVAAPALSAELGVDASHQHTWCWFCL